MEIPRFLTGSSGLNGITPSLQKSSAAKKRNVPDMNFIIRPYHEGDFPSVSLLEESGLHEPYRSAVFIRQMAGVCAGTFLVAVREDGVIGYTIGTFVQHNPAEAWILRIGVREDMRRIGAGTALLRAVMDVLYTYSVQTIRLSVSPGNQPALSLYRKQGFVQEKCIQDYFGPGEDRIIMKKERD
jgi:ribosomal-protein-alanine N-acetyltransferase